MLCIRSNVSIDQFCSDIRIAGRTSRAGRMRNKVNKANGSDVPLEETKAQTDGGGEEEVCV